MQINSFHSFRQNSENYIHIHFRQDDSTISFQNNPTAEDYEWLKNERNELIDQLTYKSEGQLKAEVTDSNRDFDVLYSDGFRIN